MHVVQCSVLNVHHCVLFGLVVQVSWRTKVAASYLQEVLRVLCQERVQLLYAVVIWTT